MRDNSAKRSDSPALAAGTVAGKKEWGCKHRSHEKTCSATAAKTATAREERADPGCDPEGNGVKNQTCASQRVKQQANKSRSTVQNEPTCGQCNSVETTTAGCVVPS